MNHSHHKLEEIWEEVPPDYYQKGVKNNFLQRLWHTGKLRTVLSLIETSPMRVLDVGCASGWFLWQVKKEFPKSSCTGIDVYKEAITYGKKKYKNLELRHADGHRLPFKANTFDVVVCCEVIEHVLDPAGLLREIRRVLKKKGVAIIEMDSGNLLFTIVWYFWTHIRHGVWEHAHIQTLNEKKLEMLIKSSGLKITKRKKFNATMAVAFQCLKN